MRLVEGRYYQRRDGCRVGPAERMIGTRAAPFDWFVGEWTYNENGSFAFSEHAFDLVREVDRDECRVATKQSNGRRPSCVS